MSTKTRKQLTKAQKEALVRKHFGTLHKIGDKLVTDRQMGHVDGHGDEMRLGPRTEVEVLEVSLPRDSIVWWHYGLYVTPVDKKHSYHGKRFYVGGQDIEYLSLP